MAADFTHSEHTRVSVGGTDISDNVDNSYLFKRRPNHTNTGYGSGAQENAPGLIDPVTFLEGPFDKTFHAVMKVLDGVAGTTLVYSPDGTAAGAPSITYNGFIANYRIAADLDKGGLRWSAFFFHQGSYVEADYS